VVKHRTLAATLIEDGHVRLNRAKVMKPAHVVRPTDVLTITMSDTVRVLRVKDTGIRRGPFSEACQLYEDLTASPSRDEKDRA
jgi:ribosome-associated heat shock protein Hsp15